MDGDISPDDLVNGKSLERDGPCDYDIWQEGNNLFEEIVRDCAFEADEIGREQRQSENQQI
jgi:hypothetical protein